MLEEAHLSLLRAHKNLLAFSGGSDSTALFHLLLEHNIDFDIALVNYHTRDESDTEANAALALAKHYNKQCFIKDVIPINTNFEHYARHERYAFFNALATQHHYTVLLTAHHLGDRLEWFLMQLSKGAGLPELLGMQTLSHEENYLLLRPLLHLQKRDLIAYLDENKIHYFNDSSNSDQRFKRNQFRHNFSQPLLDEFSQGIKKSFDYLNKDCALIIQESTYHNCNALFYFKTHSSTRSTLVLVDKILKQCGYMMSASEKEHLFEHKEHVVGRRYVVVINTNYTFIAPHVDNIIMNKTHKEVCRKLQIHTKLRPYLFQDAEAFAVMNRLLS